MGRLSTITVAIALAGCGAEAPERPDFRSALNVHLNAVQERDLDAFRATLTENETLYTIFPDGGAITTPKAAIDLHEQWFADANWRWDGEIVHLVESADMAMALLRYDYRDTLDGAPRTNWLSLVFRLEDGAWRLVHDQNTRIAESSQ